MFEVALEGMNRSEIPISIEFAKLEFLRRRDDETVVPLVLLVLVALWWELLLLLLLLLLKLMLLLLEVVSWRGDGVEGKKNRPGAPLLLLCMVSMETIGLGRKSTEGSPSLPLLGLGMILWLLGDIIEEEKDGGNVVVAGLVVDTVTGDFAVGVVWKNKEDVANLFAYCRSNRDRVGDGRGARIEAQGDCAVDVGVDDGFGSKDCPCREDDGLVE
jgi:hypothetical protein